MREQVQMRLEVLKKELETGQAELEKAEKQRAYLHEALLRISGAVQVLEELMAETQPTGQNGSGLGEKTLRHTPAQPGEVETQ